MALALADAAKLSNNIVLGGLIENTISDDPVLWNGIKWEQINGNALLYNRENALPTVAAHAVGDTWNESAPTVTQITTALAIYGDDADTDNFMRLTRSNVQDPRDIVIATKGKALMYKLSDQLIYGTGAANEMSGWQTLVAPAGTQRIHQGAGAVGAAVSLANVDALIDLIRGGRPDLLMMTRNTRRRLSQFARGNGSPVIYPLEMFGKWVQTYNGIPIGIDDFMVHTETIAGGVFTAKTGGATASIIAAKFGGGDVQGKDGTGMVYGGSTPIYIEEVSNALETKDASRIRVKSYCSLALYNSLHVAILDGITDVPAVA